MALLFMGGNPRVPSHSPPSLLATLVDEEYKVAAGASPAAPATLVDEEYKVAAPAT